MASGCRSLAVKHHLPIGLAIFTAIGFLWPDPGIALGTLPVNVVSIASIFFITGLQLQTADIRSAIAAWPALVFGAASILVLSPLLSLGVAMLDLGPAEFSRGLALFTAMPTTISSGVLMVAECGGNVAMAALFSAGTNVIAVLTAPLWFEAILLVAPSPKHENSSEGEAGEVIDAQFNPWNVLWKLTLTILLPLVAGKLAQRSSRVARFVGGHKLHLKLASSALLISVPFVTMSQSAAQLRHAQVLHVFELVLLGIALHAFLLLANFSACRLIPMALPERKSVVISASQKTMNTAISVIQFLPPSAGVPGLLTLPVLIAHFVQIVLDAVLVSHWKPVVPIVEPACQPPPTQLPSCHTKTPDSSLLPLHPLQISIADTDAIIADHGVGGSVGAASSDEKNVEEPALARAECPANALVFFATSEEPSLSTRVLNPSLAEFSAVERGLLVTPG